MFWNVTFIYNAFIRTTDHCKVQIAFVSSFYIFIKMKREMHQIQPYSRAFNEFLFEFLRFFLISENSLKFANFCWGNEFSIYALNQLKSCQLLHNCTKKSHLTRRIALSCGIKISPVGSLDYSQSTRVTDGRTHRRTELWLPRPRYHSCVAR